MSEYLVFCDPDSLEADYLGAFLRERRIPQNLFYHLDGAQSFYSYRSHDIAQIAWEDESQFFQQQPLWRDSERVAFVSLGCGNSASEKPLLRRMATAGHTVNYIGVDSSASMLELAAENLSDAEYERTFVLADFMLDDFPRRLAEQVLEADVRIYALIGGTYGNLDQTEIADMLSRLVQQGDYLYLDVVPRYASEADDDSLRARLSKLPDNMPSFFDGLLGLVGLSRAQGRFLREESRDGPLNTIRYTFYFQLTDPVRVTCLDQEAVLHPGEVVELISIRAYDPDALVAFLGQRGFDLVGTYIPNVGKLSHLWQRLLFTKVT
jgi:SAM-dependent methyltransferase